MTPSFPLSLRAIFISVSLFLPLAYAQAEGSTISIEQRSPVETSGSWTLVKPDQTSLKMSGKDETVENLAAGLYTLFFSPPEGTTITIFQYAGTEIIQKIEKPQFTFNLGDGDSYRFVVQYKLTRVGMVSVQSNPPGIPFVLRGPNSMKEEAVTPHSFTNTPTGQYTINYQPPGCTEPRPQSQVLTTNGRLNFAIEISCDTLDMPDVKQVEEDKKRLVSTEQNGQTVIFKDIPQEAWFAPFIAEVANLGILSGYKNKLGQPTGYFGPTQVVTLGELSKIAHVVAGIDQFANTGQAANQSATNEWFFPYIVSAENLAWMVYMDPTVDLLRPATRGEVIVTLLQALDVPASWPKGDLFRDVTRRTPYAGAIETAARAAVIDGRKDSAGVLTGFFAPVDSINRAEIAKMISAMIKKYRVVEE